MNIQMQQDVLLRKLKAFASEAMEARQVSYRLKDLLPSRIKNIKHSYGSGARAERRSFTDQAYLNYVDEFLDVTATAITARVQYETHVMLFQARQSLRPLNKFQK